MKSEKKNKVIGCFEFEDYPIEGNPIYDKINETIRKKLRKHPIGVLIESEENVKNLIQTFHKSEEMYGLTSDERKYIHEFKYNCKLAWSTDNKPYFSLYKISKLGLPLRNGEDREHQKYIIDRKLYTPESKGENFGYGKY
ncbi:MAG: hypothetical protein ACLQQ4_12305 [Bacteroidia bacterium]